ncbi:TetR/AcrR family transcriptional regulator [Candidatus Sulfurimonas marisnigri]|uniref:TetR/AcrR family transcriptional regulator n=1 Tax=Candidatus Sulfurimonas marisnigri TaxID=2740405 RepID=A0A7S7RQL0_9BACT|nr:TetR/AcrR family transcriptional regulator [Candidatus Sulfurimonas marisnigri]QOY54791.1 TetR/AcrR family transcriptional regulator [Candidatus Sulfurimonas marisnigri]
MSTKERILQTALELFNSGNTQMATTNHIAKAMNISPGNLHYHYKNREEIIRVLYKQMRSKASLPIEELPTTILELNKHLKDLLEILWEYRFFYKELLFLFSRDSELEKMCVEDNLKHRQRIIKSIENFIKNGELELHNGQSTGYVADYVLMTEQFYFSYSKTLGKEIDRDSVRETINHINGVFRPYLTKKAIQNLKLD